MGKLSEPQINKSIIQQKLGREFSQDQLIEATKFCNHGSKKQPTLLCRPINHLYAEVEKRIVTRLAYRIQISLRWVYRIQTMQYPVIVNQPCKHHNCRASILNYHLPEVFERISQWTLGSYILRKAFCSRLQSQSIPNDQSSDTPTHTGEFLCQRQCHEYKRHFEKITSFVITFT